jgi:hypothetical protein
MVTQFAVIHVKAYCHLRAVDNLVHHAGIIWVDLKSDTHQTLGEFAINHVIVSSSAMVTQFAVIHVKAYCHLRAIDNLVC